MYVTIHGIHYTLYPDILDIGCTKTRSCAIKLGSATFVKFFNITNNSFPIILYMSPYRIDYIMIHSCVYLPWTPRTSILLRIYSSRFFMQVFLLHYAFDSRWTFSSMTSLAADCLNSQMLTLIRFSSNSRGFAYFIKSYLHNVYPRSIYFWTFSFLQRIVEVLEGFLKQVYVFGLFLDSLNLDLCSAVLL